MDRERHVIRIYDTIQVNSRCQEAFDDDCFRCCCRVGCRFVVSRCQDRISGRHFQSLQREISSSKGQRNECEER